MFFIYRAESSLCILNKHLKSVNTAFSARLTSISVPSFPPSPEESEQKNLMWAKLRFLRFNPVSSLSALKNGDDDDDSEAVLSVGAARPCARQYAAAEEEERSFNIDEFRCLEGHNWKFGGDLGASCGRCGLPLMKNGEVLQLKPCINPWFCLWFDDFDCVDDFTLLFWFNLRMYPYAFF